MSAPGVLPGFPLFSDQVAWSIDPNTSYTAAQLRDAWTSIAGRVWNSTMTQGRQYELGQQQAGTGLWTCDNTDEALNPTNTSSPFWPYLLPYRLCRTVAVLPTSGNILNDSNLTWVDAPVGSADADFEDGSIGHWTSFGPTAPALSNGTLHVHSGTKAMRLLPASSPGPIANGNGAQLRVPVIPGVVTTITVWAWIVANLTQCQINVPGLGSSTIDTTQGAYAQMTLTITPTTSTIPLQVLIGSGAGTGSVWIDTIQVEFGASASSFSTSGPTFYCDVLAQIERLPEVWDKGGYRGISALPLVDAFALLPRINLPDTQYATIIADLPLAYYPLREPAGATVVSDATGVNGTGFIGVPHPNYFGQTGGSAVIGDSQSVCLDDFPSVKLSNTVEIPAPYIQLPLSTIPGGTGAGPWTIEQSVWIDPQTVADGSNVTTFDHGAYSTTQLSISGILISLAVSGISPTTLLIAVMSGQYVNIGDPVLPLAIVFSDSFVPDYILGLHHIAVTMASDNKTISLYVDGVFIGTSVASASVPVAAATTPPCIGARISASGGLSANVGDHAVWNSVLTPTQIAAHAAATTTGFAGETSGSRYARILSYIDPSIVTSVDAGMSTMGPATGLGSQTLMQGLTDVVVAEGGNHFIDRSGVLTFSSRADRYLEHTATWLFGENTAGGEIPYLGDLEFDFDTTYVINDSTVQRPGGVAQNVFDLTSIGRYFDSDGGGPLSVNLFDDNQVRDVATWNVQQYKDPHLRLASLTFEPASFPAAWVCWLTARQGDRVTVHRRTSGGPQMSVDFYIEQIARTRGPGAAQMTLLMSPVWSTTVWQLGDTTYGALGTTTILAR